ncbi:MAG: GTPase [Candidatus Woesearchaeota archaeon]
MPNFWKIVNQVIDEADVLLLLLDARLIEETRNREIEDKIKRQEKPLIYVITKSDLVDKEQAERDSKKLFPSVFISAKEHQGTNKLREKILVEAKRLRIELVTVGVLGYPNVGKSSLINALKGKKAARTSILAGYTKGVQKVKAGKRILLLDTPGVIPYKEKDHFKHALIGTLDFTRIQEPDMIVLRLLEKFPGKVEKFYGVEQQEDLEEIIEEIAIKKNILIKGGKPDLIRTAIMILKDWQKGEIN